MSFETYHFKHTMGNILKPMKITDVFVTFNELATALVTPLLIGFPPLSRFNFNQPWMASCRDL